MSSAKNRKAPVPNPYHLRRWSLPSLSVSWLGVKVEYIQCGLDTHIREALTGRSSFKSMSLVNSENAHRTTIRVVTSKEQEGVEGEQRASGRWLRGSIGGSSERARESSGGA